MEYKGNPTQKKTTRKIRMIRVAVAFLRSHALALGNIRPSNKEGIQKQASAAQVQDRWEIHMEEGQVRECAGGGL